MSAKGRKRNVDAVVDQEGVGGGAVSKATRSRRAVKIEVEEDVKGETSQSRVRGKAVAKMGAKKVVESTEDTEEEVSSYFKKEEEEDTKTEGEPVDDGTGSEKKTKRKPKEEKVKVKVEPPSDWETVLKNIKIMRSTKTAAVDTMGCERTADLTQEPKVQRFHTLVSLMLSSQTKDQVTFAAMERLKERGLTVQSMLDVQEAELAEIIKPVGFFKRKATYIKKTAEVLREKFADDIPSTVDELMSLPGVGPKMAYICMTAAWNENVGIGVDTHVHRITNRLKWTGKKGTSTPEQTRAALESWMPKDIWQEINILLVGFGQEICLPLRPKCESCLNKNICPASSVPKSKSKSKKASNESI